MQPTVMVCLLKFNLVHSCMSYNATSGGLHLEPQRYFMPLQHHFVTPSNNFDEWMLNSWICVIDREAVCSILKSVLWLVGAWNRTQIKAMLCFLQFHWQRAKCYKKWGHQYHEHKYDIVQENDIPRHHRTESKTHAQRQEVTWGAGGVWVEVGASRLPVAVARFSSSCTHWMMMLGAGFWLGLNCSLRAFPNTTAETDKQK